ncbi:mycofactocin-coupled SDR family oxidoreductase [Flexivirga caeni]|uniref:SDR family oxidoreductase n=1 Tax=Flexivirga caeni TaxID=2294115 RepID=A0A3M9M2V7_9MICO|nr:mycofactocin-coupled SDR family oxidoreductase [Flexivirga caeni]RNI19846.1 SDR family oxidoreductase [Flexivirga caeni]
MIGRVVVLGGGGRGIGATTARLLAARGDTAVVLDAFDVRDSFYPLADGADRAAVQEISGVETVSVDLRDAAATRTAVTDAVQRHGRIDAVVAFAGAVSGGHPLWETTEETLQQALAFNTLTTWHLARAALPHLLTRPATASPAFVALTSVAGEKGLFGLAPYVVAKHATVGVVHALAADLAGTPVTACGIAPGSTDTTMLRQTAAAYGLSDVTELAQYQHGRRPLQPEDVARVVLFALDAGRVVHGAILPADAGFGRV